MNFFKSILTTLLLTSQTQAFLPFAQHHQVSNLVLSSSTASITEVNPRLEGLALLLDDGTRKSHSVAENTAFVQGFFKGLSTQDAYKSLLTSLYFVYGAMELSFDECDSTEVKILDDDKLRRLESLSTDMTYFYGPEWRNDIKPSYYAQKYVNRIEEVARDKPYLLIGHQYSRYLGDLFGGQMMGSMASKSLSLEKGTGTAFYSFDDIDNTRDYITEWYTKLNNLDLTQEQKDEIVDEANLVFDLNIGIFEELEGSALKALWSFSINSIKDKLGMK